jgi:hypothetical protein
VPGKCIQLEDMVLQATKGSRSDLGALRVLGLHDGTVYLSTLKTFRDASLPCWSIFISISVEHFNFHMLLERYIVST